MTHVHVEASQASVVLCTVYAFSYLRGTSSPPVQGSDLRVPSPLPRMTSPIHVPVSIGCTGTCT